MNIRVLVEKCTGCGLCVEACPLDNLRLDEAGRPYVKYDECWYCGACEFDCPEGAIRVQIPFQVR